MNYAGTAAALALELEDELNSRFLDPEDFQPQQVFHTAQAKNEYKKKRQDMLREYGEKTSVLPALEPPPRTPLVALAGSPKPIPASGSPC